MRGCTKWKADRRTGFWDRNCGGSASADVQHLGRKRYHWSVHVEGTPGSRGEVASLREAKGQANAALERWGEYMYDRRRRG